MPSCVVVECGHTQQTAAGRVEHGSATERSAGGHGTQSAGLTERCHAPRPVGDGVAGARGLGRHSWRPRTSCFHHRGTGDCSATELSALRSDHLGQSGWRATHILRRVQVRSHRHPATHPDSVGSDRLGPELRPNASRVSSMKANPRRTSGRRVMRRSPTREGGVSIWLI